MSNGEIYLYIGFILALTDFQQIKEENISWPTEEKKKKKRSEIIEDEQSGSMTRGQLCMHLMRTHFRHGTLYLRNKNDYKCNKQSKRTKEGCLHVDVDDGGGGGDSGSDNNSGVCVCTYLNARHTQQPNDKVSFNSCGEIVFYWMFLLILKKMKSGENSPFSQYTPYGCVYLIAWEEKTANA